MPSRVLLAAAKLSSVKRCPSTPTLMASFTWAAGSVGMRWQRCVFVFACVNVCACWAVGCVKINGGGVGVCICVCGLQAAWE